MFISSIYSDQCIVKRKSFDKGTHYNRIFMAGNAYIFHDFLLFCLLHGFQDTIIGKDLIHCIDLPGPYIMDLPEINLVCLQILKRLFQMPHSAIITPVMWFSGNKHFFPAMLKYFSNIPFAGTLHCQLILVFRCPAIICRSINIIHTKVKSSVDNLYRFFFFARCFNGSLTTQAKNAYHMTCFSKGTFG